MPRPKNNFLQTPANFLFHHSGISSATAQNSAHSAIPSRLIFQWQTSFDVSSNRVDPKEKSDFEKEVQKDYDRKLKGLSAKIKQLENEKNAQGEKKSPAEIKAAIKAEKTKLLQEAFNQALKNLKIYKDIKTKTPVTYLEVVNDSNYGPRIEAIYKEFEAKAEPDIDKAVDQYYKQKALATGRAVDALTALPPATAALDQQSPNPEIPELEKFRAQREQISDQSKNSRQGLLQNESARWRATTAKIDELTSPDSGLIDDFDDGLNPLSKIDDINSPTRYRLNGYLYANYIFGGGGESGMNSVNAGIKKPYELYHSWADSRLTMQNLENDLGLQSYFKEAKEYSNFDRPIGMMAGLLKLIDDNIKDPSEHQRYIEYVRGKFAEIKTGPAANDEEKQMEHLFGIKSRAAFLDIQPNWRNALDTADQMTDPTRKGAKITDYPGTFSSNKDNPTRHQLNGYLYSAYLFNGKNNSAIQSQFDRAVKIYEESGHIDEDFTQAHLEDKNGQEGFGLGVYLHEAETFTKFDTVKGVIAGLLKQAESIPKSEDFINYQKYLRDKFTLISKSESEDSQLMLLSTIHSPAQAIQERHEEMRIAIVDLMVKASKQHNQFKFSPELIEAFSPEQPTQDSKIYQQKASDARTEMQTFIYNRAEPAMKDLQEKYQILLHNNKSLKSPRFAPNQLNPLRLAVEKINKQFAQARAISSTTEFRAAVEDKYLAKLATAEKAYYSCVADLDLKLKAVNDQVFHPNSSSNAESNTAGSETGGSNSKLENAGETVDPYTANWSKAERVTPRLDNYTGPLTVNSTDPQEKVIGYNWKGEHLMSLNNNTHVFRTPLDAEQPARKVENLNFVRVTYGGRKVVINGKDTERYGKKVWIPEEQLFRK